MKKVMILPVILAMIFVVDCGKSSEKPAKADFDKTSYAVGYDVASRTGLVEIAKEVDVDVLLQGLRDALSGKEAKISAEEREKIIEKFKEDMTEKQLEQAKQQGEKNKVEGKAFLEKNAKKAGVKTTASGLQYEVLRTGSGVNARAIDRVKVHYRGTLVDGTEFDSSYKRGEPIVFPLKGVIPGWTEGVQLMNVGSQYRLTIPPHLAYGEQGAGRLIAPHAVLIFEIELLGIEPGVEPAKK